MTRIDYYRIRDDGSEEFVISQNRPLPDFILWLNFIQSEFKARISEDSYESPDICILRTGRMKYVCVHASNEDASVSRCVWTGKDDILCRFDSGCWAEELGEMTEKRIDAAAEEIADSIDWDDVAQAGIVAGNEYLDGRISDYFAERRTR